MSFVPSPGPTYSPPASLPVLIEPGYASTPTIKLPSGAVVQTTRPGTGAQPDAADRVKVHYEGRLLDGSVFDSSYKRNEPAVFQLGGVIKCWTEGVGRMKVGEQAVLTCPSDMAYGDGGRPPTIPGGATLIFDVELLGIEAPPPAPPPGQPGMGQFQLPPPKMTVPPPGGQPKK